MENDDENGLLVNQVIMIEMNGSVYEGDFHAYWRVKFEIDVDNNSSSNWRENVLMPIKVASTNSILIILKSEV